MAKRAARAKGKTKTAGRKVGGPIPVSITKAEEYWSIYKLSDGTTVRVRPIMVEIMRQRNKFDDKGNPFYTIKGGMIQELKSPNKLKRRKR